MNWEMKKAWYVNLLLILLLITFNIVQFSIFNFGSSVNTSIYSKNIDAIDPEFSNKITNSYYEYIISGKTGEVSSPTIVCTSDNNIVIVWMEEGQFKIAKYTDNLEILTNQSVMFDANELSLEEFDLSKPRMLIDSEDNLHFFWIVLKFDYPQQEDIYYFKMTKNLTPLQQPTIVHTYTLSGNTNSVNDNLISKISLDDENNVHLLVDDNTYYIINNIGDILATTSIPSELGTVEDLLIVNNDVFIACVKKTLDNINNIRYYEIYNIKYSFNESSITEQKQNLLFDTTDIFHINNLWLQKIDSNPCFYWNWDEDETHIIHKESFLLNSDGSLGESVFLNEYLFSYVKYYHNSKYAAALDIGYELYTSASLNITIFHPTQSKTYVEEKLLIRFLRNESLFWGPHISGPSIISDRDSEFVLTWYVNDGGNGFQIFLWKCNFDGEISAPLTIVAPVESQPIPFTSVVKFYYFTFLLCAIVILIPIAYKQKRMKKFTN